MENTHIPNMVKSERKLFCRGISYINDAEKWIAVIRPRGQSSVHCGYAETEEEAIRMKDRHMIGKVYGPGSKHPDYKTFFDEKDYDLEKLGKDYLQYKVETAILEAKFSAPSLENDVGDDFLIKEPVLIPIQSGTGEQKYMVKSTCMGASINLGTVENKEGVEQLVKSYLRSDKYLTIINTIQTLRDFSINKFKSYPSDQNFKFLMYTHGQENLMELAGGKVTRQDLIDNLPGFVTSQTHDSDTEMKEEEAHV